MRSDKSSSLFNREPILDITRELPYNLTALTRVSAECLRSLPKVLLLAVVAASAYRERRALSVRMWSAAIANVLTA